jgi:ATP-dependent exoDNAse (exonuclease V) alpha subunit
MIEKLRSEKNNGNCFLDVEDVFEYVRKKRIDWRECFIDMDTINAYREFFEEKLVLIERSGKTYIYLKSVYDDERFVENKVKELLQRKKHRESTLDWKERINSRPQHIPKTLYVRLLNEQATALENSYRCAFSIITGAAGTGKTQVVSALIQGIKDQDGRQKFLLLAPTGKAATRLTQRTGVQAKTIHRVLMENGWLNKETYRFEPNGKPLVEHNIIIDEASMIDLELMAQLFRAIDWNRVKRFILVGDPNQLPPIGFGRPFLDIIGYLKSNPEFKDAITSLTINCRQLQENSATLKLAEIFKAGKPEKNYEEMLNRIAKAEQHNGVIGKDLEVYYWKDEVDLEDTIMQKLNDLLKHEFTPQGEPEYARFNRLLGLSDQSGERSLDYFQIITPYRGYYYGTAALNALVQKEFRSGLLKRKQVKGFTSLDKVIQIQNTTVYKGSVPIPLFNGQLGYIKRLYVKPPYGQEKIAYVKFLDVQEDIEFTESGRYPILENLELGYAISVHKAQGSDFGIVFLILPKENISLLSRELVYTALTRSKKKVVLFLQSDVEPLLKAMHPSNSAIAGRNTSMFIFRFTSTKYRETDLIHHTKKGEVVRSKSEVIIANELYNQGVSYEYERPLWSKDGSSFRIPDFTVFYEGEEYYWEHLGMLDDPEYMQKWEEKRRWYEQNGFADRLVVSQEDASGLDSRKIAQIIETKFK